MILLPKKIIAMILALIAQQEAMDKNFKPLGEITGTDTGVERSMASMITSQKEFVNVWYAHKELFGDPPTGVAGIELEAAQIPKVDFSKNVVIAYFAGQTTAIVGYEMLGVDSKGKSHVVRIRPQMLDTGTALMSNSYGMWVFPRPKKAIDLELVVGYEGGKPVTRKLAHFEPPKQAKQG